MQNTITERPLNTKEAAEFLGYRESYIYQLLNKRKLTFYKTGNKVCFKREDLEKYLYRNRIAADYEVEEQAEKILNGGRK
ncbi:MAG: excisionase family DNA-binding protein [Spirochaetaceae bacterium]|nr:excisionase family DNA-binding protein [Spirochaetaceae bacterium]